MLGNRRTSDVEITGDVAGGHLALTNEMENRKPGWVPHRLDCAKNWHVINFPLVCLYERLYLRYKVVCCNEGYRYRQHDRGTKTWLSSGCGIPGALSFSTSLRKSWSCAGSLRP